MVDRYKKRVEELKAEQKAFQEEEREFLLSDRRWEKLLIFNGLLVCLWAGGVFGSSYYQVASKITTILFGALTLQLFSGLLFALLLFWKKELGKSLYYSALFLHFLGGVFWSWIFFLTFVSRS